MLLAVWGTSRPTQAKEVIFRLLMPGHRLSPVMRTRYERLVWMARAAREAGVAQVLFKATWESRHQPVWTGLVRRALHVAHQLGWCSAEGSWR